LVELWEDYHFVLSCDRCTPEQGKPILTDEETQTKSWDILSKTPLLIRMFQAQSVLANELMHWVPSFFHIAFMLNVGWDDMREALRPIQFLVTEEEKAKLMAIFAHMRRDATSDLLPFDRPALCRDLACTFLRVLKKVIMSGSPLSNSQATW
jgi:hypothetical protein